MHHRTFTSRETHTSYFQRKVYAYYLLFLYEYVKDNDELKLFQKLEEPSVGNPLAIQKDGKRISQDISNSYMEYSYIRNSLGNDFKHIKNVAEIGGGYGRLCYLFHLFHQNEGLKITLIDLPPAMMVAQWYMRKMFPEAKIMDYRKFSYFSEIDEEYHAASIRFLLPHQLELLPEDEIDLLINVSSLQEMSREQINHYYELIDKKSRYFYTKQWVMWENAEDKISVPAIIYPTRPHWGLVNARLNPVHTQFFEAMFKIR
jgi:putative sugar O-methyltransferase